MSERRRRLERGQEIPFIFVPSAGEHLLDWFWDLCTFRLRTEQTEPLSPVLMESWARLSGVSIRPWEFRILADMDSAFREGPLLPGADLQPRRAELTPANFDDLFEGL